MSSPSASLDMPRYDYEYSLINLNMPKDEEGNPTWVGLDSNSMDPAAVAFYPPPDIFTTIVLHADGEVYEAETLMLTSERDEYQPSRLVFVYQDGRYTKVAFSWEVRLWKLAVARPSYLHRL